MSQVANSTATLLPMRQQNRYGSVAGYTYSYDADGTRSQRIARVDRPSGTVHYYFSNHLGSHTMVTSATGTCEQDIDYYPYGGVVIDHCPNVAQHYKFTGKERDTESGLDNFEARYFASTMGRFLTPDWAARPTNVPYAVFGDPQSLNLYGYVRNDPVTLADADGHDPPVPVGPTVDGSGTTADEESQQTPTVKEAKAENKGDTSKKEDPPKKDPTPASKTSDPSIVLVVAAGAGLAPQANGAANAAKDAAKNFMKSTKPDPPLRGAPGETPDVTRLSPMRQLLKDAVDVLGGAINGAAGGSTEILIIAPVPKVPPFVPIDSMPDTPYHGPV